MSDRFFIGFIGFGEAGFEIARGLHSSGVSRMCLYDLRMQDPDKAALIRDRAREVEGKILGSVQEVAVHSDIILSLVTPEASVAVAGEAAAHLKPGQHRQAC